MIDDALDYIEDSLDPKEEKVEEEKLKLVMKHTNEILSWMQAWVWGEKEFISLTIDMVEQS